MPALYLAGLPDGDEAHAVWERGIKLWVVEALVRAQFGIGDLPDRLIYRHLVARLQADMGLFRGLAEDMSPDLELLADALRNDRQHPLSTLWEAKIDSDDPEQMRLLESEVALLLDWIGDEVGDWRLLELLPALAEYPRLDTALLATYRLPPVEFEAEWFAHLSNVTGVTGPSGSNPDADAGALETPRASFLTGDRNRPRGGGGIL